MALSKKHRLTDKLKIEEVFKKGRIINSNFFFIKFRRNRLPFSRFLVIVSSKISKKAVIRNKVKRRLNEIIRLNVLKDKPGYDLIVMTKSGILDQEYSKLREVLVNELNRLNNEKQVHKNN